MNSLRIFNQYPLLYFIVALAVISNNIFKYAKGQVLSYPLSIIIPSILVVFGIMAYIKNKKNV